MSDPVERRLLEVCWEAGGLAASRARNVSDRRAYQKRCAQNYLATERERIERWLRDFDVSVSNMAQALVDGSVPPWWLGQLRNPEHPDITPTPDAEIIPFPLHLVRPAQEEPCEDASSSDSATTPTTPKPTSSRKKKQSAT